MQETQEKRVRSLGREDPLAEEAATHSSILTWENPWTGEPGRLGYRPKVDRAWHNWVTKKNVSHSVMYDSAIPWTAAHQVPLSIRFLKQEYMDVSLSKLRDTVNDREAWHGAEVAKSRTWLSNGATTNLASLPLYFSAPNKCELSLQSFCCKLILYFMLWHSHIGKFQFRGIGQR